MGSIVMALLAALPALIVIALTIAWILHGNWILNWSGRPATNASRRLHQTVWALHDHWARVAFFFPDEPELNLARLVVLYLPRIVADDRIDDEIPVFKTYQEGRLPRLFLEHEARHIEREVRALSDRHVQALWERGRVEDLLELATVALSSFVHRVRLHEAHFANTPVLVPLSRRPAPASSRSVL